MQTFFKKILNTIIQYLVKTGRRSKDNHKIFCLIKGIELGHYLSYTDYCIRYGHDINNNKLSNLFDIALEIYNYERI